MKFIEHIRKDDGTTETIVSDDCDGWIIDGLLQAQRNERRATYGPVRRFFSNVAEFFRDQYGS